MTGAASAAADSVGAVQRPHHVGQRRPRAGARPARRPRPDGDRQAPADAGSPCTSVRSRRGRAGRRPVYDKRHHGGLGPGRLRLRRRGRRLVGGRARPRAGARVVRREPRHRGASTSPAPSSASAGGSATTGSSLEVTSPAHPVHHVPGLHGRAALGQAVHRARRAAAPTCASCAGHRRRGRRGRGRRPARPRRHHRRRVPDPADVDADRLRRMLDEQPDLARRPRATPSAATWPPGPGDVAAIEADFVRRERVQTDRFRATQRRRNGEPLSGSARTAGSVRACAASRARPGPVSVDGRAMSPPGREPGPGRAAGLERPRRRG